jgi:uncharacterized protein YycO
MLFIGMRIALYQGTGWISKAIMWISRGGYSHVAMLLNDDTLIEAWAGGVRHRKNLKDKMDTDTLVDVFEVPTTPEQDIIIQSFLEKQIGKGYDYLAIVGFILHTTHEGRIQYGKWICSELVFAAFQKVKINLLDRVECWKVSPTILSYSTLLKNGQRHIIKKSKRFGLMKHPCSIHPSTEKLG